MTRRKGVGYSWLMALILRPAYGPTVMWMGVRGCIDRAAHENVYGNEKGHTAKSDYRSEYQLLIRFEPNIYLLLMQTFLRGPGP
ncbi:hypothetical protein F4819DRAFT_404598 [Hypoxylon fuscum]|nr:hypothetical protein F4819DRAFT_404598 [Hypoxylon fuscum]